jgi:DNA polymerase-4
MPRKIIHIDADCFFAAIEMRDNPELRNRPMAVGGSPLKRGVISTCNYEARKFGVRSAMASALAMRACPSLVIVPHSMNKYREASQIMRGIFLEYTDLVEPLSLDEAFLDVSECTQLQGSATRIAEQIRARVEASLNITVSAGVAPNKFLAKVASDWQKPDGLTVVVPSAVDEFVHDLPVERIYGVGKVTAEKMRRLEIYTCGDLRRYSLFELTEAFGSFGPRLHSLCRGIDERPVRTSRRRKSLSVEHTFEQDLTSLEACLDQLPELLVKLQQRLQRLEDDYLVVKGFVKVKFDDFTSTTLERAGTRAQLTDYRQLLEEAFERGARPVRLLGLGVRFVELKADSESVQLDFFNSKNDLQLPS